MRVMGKSGGTREGGSIGTGDTWYDYTDLGEYPHYTANICIDGKMGKSLSG